ncbi:pyruvate carboxylase [Candidatus Moduliflexus flocculans]|uniref:Pyruvate carboxylase n=1 Tax=Candidatus Moduliflexus flocculans TaxID=1499966 RepID=A0A0S6VY95_9BACT|nr:pyruvate carboxylase [Candidatus Moduliflexus flocculans]
MTKQKKYWLIMAGVVVFALSGSFAVQACQGGYFRDFSGQTNVQLNNTYKYSVFAEGRFKNINFSATGGEVLNTWNENNQYFAEVRWTQNDPNDPTKLKVYGEDGCDKMQDLRYFMEVSNSRSPNDNSNNDNNANLPQGTVRFFEQSSGQGKSFVATRSMSKLASRWNDKIRSVWVGKNITITLYEHANYGGRSVELTGEGRGTMYNLSEVGFDRVMSSFEIE